MKLLHFTLNNRCRVVRDIAKYYPSDVIQLKVVDGKIEGNTYSFAITTYRNANSYASFVFHIEFKLWESTTIEDYQTYLESLIQNSDLLHAGGGKYFSCTCTKFNLTRFASSEYSREVTVAENLNEAVILSIKVDPEAQLLGDTLLIGSIPYTRFNLHRTSLQETFKELPGALKNPIPRVVPLPIAERFDLIKDDDKLRFYTPSDDPEKDRIQKEYAYMMYYARQEFDEQMRNISIHFDFIFKYNQDSKALINVDNDDDYEEEFYVIDTQGQAYMDELNEATQVAEAHYFSLKSIYEEIRAKDLAELRQTFEPNKRFQVSEMRSMRSRW